MKLRKLILNAKLKQIEKQHQNILVFHCNLTASQWCQLKNLLYKNSFLTSSEDLQNIYSETKLKNKIRTVPYKVLYLSKSSSHMVQKSVNFPDVMNDLEKPKKAPIKLIGCLFFFDKESENLFQGPEGPESKSKPLEFINKLESTDLNKNLLLLYGQMNQKALNHLDLKRALELDPEQTYQQLLLSFHLLGSVLNSFLYQNINEFFQLQQTYVTSSSRNRQDKEMKPACTEANNGN